jgi:tetratricopeptide (TPR) repeat protein
VLGFALWLSSSAAVGQDIPLPVERFSAPAIPNSSARAAVDDLKLAVAQTPDSAQAWTNLGWRLYKNGQYAESEWTMGEARKRDGRDPYALWLSGLAAYSMGHIADAKDFLWKMWKDNRSWPSTVNMAVTYDILGRIALDQGDLFQATYFLGKASDEDPDNWQLSFILGIAEWYRGRYAEALAAVEKARSLNSSDKAVIVCYAWARLAVDERHAAYTKDAADKGLWPEANEDAKEADRQYKEDIKYIEDALNADPQNSDTYELLGRYYKSVGQTDQAISALRKAISLNALRASAQYFLAEILRTRGRPHDRDEAEQLLLRAVALEPGYSESGGLLVSLLVEDGKVTEAQSLTDWLDARDGERR